MTGGIVCSASNWTFCILSHGFQIRSIMVIGGPDGTSPSSMKVFTNRDGLDFETISDLPATQVHKWPPNGSTSTYQQVTNRVQVEGASKSVHSNVVILTRDGVKIWDGLPQEWSLLENLNGQYEYQVSQVTRSTPLAYGTPREHRPSNLSRDTLLLSLYLGTGCKHTSRG